MTDSDSIVPTRVDFYVMSGGDKDNLSCRLAAKAVTSGSTVYICTADSSQSKVIDDRLWTFSDTSFIPHILLHEMEGAPGRPGCHVVIGDGAPPSDFTDVLLSLRTEAPEFFVQFDRVLDVVGTEREEIEAGRSRFRFYRERGSEPVTHRL